MQQWERVPNSRLTRINQPSSSSNLTISSSNPSPSQMAEINNDNNDNSGLDENQNNNGIVHPPPQLSLHDRMYPPRTAQHSCFNYPGGQGNHFELKSQHISMLPKFSGTADDDAYYFIRKFENVCTLIRYQQLNDDTVKLKFIPFALTDKAEKWLCGLPSNTIRTWDDFVKIFLRKFYPYHKMAALKSQMLQHKQSDREPFWKYFERLKELLIMCPHHGFEKWRLCQLVYDGLDYTTKTMLESMCQGGFTHKTEDEAWNFLEEFSEKTLQWEAPNERAPSERAKGGMHSIADHVANDARYSILAKRVEALEIRRPENQIASTSQRPVNDQFFPNESLNPSFNPEFN